MIQSVEHSAAEEQDARKNYMDDIIMIISLYIVFCLISVARVFSLIFWALLRAHLIWGSGLWLFLCFSLHRLSDSFAFLQVRYQTMITRGTRFMHRGSNVWKNILQSTKKRGKYINTVYISNLFRLFIYSIHLNISKYIYCCIIYAALVVCLFDTFIAKPPSVLW